MVNILLISNVQCMHIVGPLGSTVCCSSALNLFKKKTSLFFYRWRNDDLQWNWLKLNAICIAICTTNFNICYQFNVWLAITWLIANSLCFAWKVVHLPRRREKFRNCQWSLLNGSRKTKEHTSGNVWARQYGYPRVKFSQVNLS